MFVFSAVNTVLMCLTVFGAYAYRPNWLVALCLIVWGAWMFLAHIVMLPPAIFSLFLMLVVAAVVGKRRSIKPRRFASWCAVCVVAAYSISLVCFIPLYAEHQRLLARFPAEDLSPRLAYEYAAPAGARPSDPAALPVEVIAHPSGVSSATSPPHDAVQLSELEQDLARQHRHGWRSDLRQQALISLSQIHTNFVFDFIAQPGFGYGRMPLHVVSESDFEMADDRDNESPAPPPIPLALEVPDQPSGTIEELENLNAEPLAKLPSLFHEPAPGANTGADWQVPSALRDLNRDSVLNFASSFIVGSATTPRNVRAFQPHAFREPAKTVGLGIPPADWAVNRLELVSLLKHRPGAVYLSEHLPRMEELRDAPTRPMTRFESSAVTRLQAGEEIVIEEGKEDLLMLGSIRAATACAKCHHVEVGGLLGAFSYHLRPQSMMLRVKPTTGRVTQRIKRWAAIEG